MPTTLTSHPPQTLQVGLLCAALTVGWFGGAALRPASRARFSEIDVERINIVEPDGKVRMVLSNAARFPQGLVDGKAVPRSSGASPGILFYNAEGDECGGLRFDSKKVDGRAAAGASLLFDQYKQDQTVGILYDEFDGHRSAGLQVWDRPDASLAQGKGPASGVKRVFVGKTREQASTLVLADPQGRRIVLSVEADGAAKLQFLDETGHVVQALPK